MATLSYQLIKSILKNCNFSGDKHSLKKEKGADFLKETHMIFSYQYKDNLIDFIKQFVTFMNEKYPKIKLARDINIEHFNEFLETLAKTSSTETLKTYCSYISKIERCVNKTWHIKKNWHTELCAPTSEKTPDGKRLRDQTMLREHYEALVVWGKERNSKFYIAVDLSARFGLRVEGCASIRYSDIHLYDSEMLGFWQLGVISVTEKGGRRRNVDVHSEENRLFLENLLTMRDGKKPEELVVGLKKDSINRQVNRALQALNLKHLYPVSSIHAVRKMYSQEIWDKCRDNSMSKKDSIRYCNRVLGHSEERNVSLLKRYVAVMS